MRKSLVVVVVLTTSSFVAVVVVTSGFHRRAPLISNSNSETGSRLSVLSTPPTRPPPTGSPNPACAGATIDIFTLLVSQLRRSGVRLFLLETSDLLRAASSANATARLLDPGVILSRYGVFAEDAESLDAAVDVVTLCRDRVRVRRRHQNGVVVNIIVVVDAKADDLNGVLKSASVPYYQWKRVHFRLFHRRGRKGAEYRWTGAETDDDGNFNLPAEAFDDFRLAPVTPEEKLFFRPADVELFVWRREASEFKECNEANRRRHQTHPKGKPLVVESEINAFMTSISEVRQLMTQLRVLSFLNCGTLLGWWRQCSIIPGDADVDLLHWSSVDLYPEILRRFKTRKELFRVRQVNIDYGPFPKILGRQEGFFIKLSVLGGKSTDIYFNYRRKIYDTRHKGGSVDRLDFTDRICSADLHGRLVYVPCTDKKIDLILRMEYGNGYLSPA